MSATIHGAKATRDGRAFVHQPLAGIVIRRQPTCDIERRNMKKSTTSPGPRLVTGHSE